MNTDLVLWLQKWASQKVEGEWEHFYNVDISTLENPGWMVKFDLEDTKYEKLEFHTIKEDNSESDWITCRVKNKVFEGVGDLSKLERILLEFKAWVEEIG